MDTANTTVPSLERRFELSPERPHPGIFVSDFYVLRSLEKPRQHIQRHVQLHRGLNILWADPNPPEKAASKKRSKVAGHTAGKSTFCRLIRYALGDVNFGNETQEYKIKNKFKDGWVVLRVEVEGTPWIVGRAFIDHAQHFAIPGGDLDAFLALETVPKTGYGDFAGLLDRHFIKPLLRDRFPGTKDEIHWQHLIPWFTRDQESRLLSIITWRGPIGKNNAISTDADERHYLMRLVLDLLPEGEADKLKEHEDLNELKRELDKVLPLTSARTDQAFTQLTEWFETKLEKLEGPLYLSAVKEEQRQKQEAINALRQSIPTTSEVETQRKKWEEAKSAASEAAAEFKSAKRRVTQLEKAIRGCEARLIEQHSQVNRLRGMAPVTVCGMPIAEACEAGKKHHAGRIDIEAVEALLKIFEEAKSQVESDLAEASENVAVQRLAKDQAEAAERDAQSAYLTLNSRREEKLEEYLLANAEQKTRERLINSTAQVLTQKTQEEDSLKIAKSEINKIGDEEAKARKEKAPALGHFSALYERILRFMLEDEEAVADNERIYGAVQHDGRKLELTANGRNDLDSGAITAAKLISFDLAAMVWGMEGKGHHPRFVIHDSPREADMAEDIYAGLFNVALALEKACGDQNSFQYIVTTTAKPPGDFNGKPWRLDPVLNALVPKQRILGLDL
ncbi:MAG: DUF2326 domain-containing protein [Verrucomicrobia bacterium]|nr:DUF2326 domain-containing protein [Verrucomicrobiota bacterium]